MAIEKDIALGQSCRLPGVGAGDPASTERIANRIYLDFNASTPLAPEVVDAMTPYLTEEFGNPSSTHWAGAAARDAVEVARLKVAMLVGCDPTETALEPLLHGGPQEAGRRPGTESALVIVGLGAACQVAQQWVHDDRIGDLTEQFWRLLRERFPEEDRAVLNGHPTERLPNTLNIRFPGYDGDEVLGQLGGVAASTGSACHAGQAEMSPVLRAMGVDERAGLGAIRFSLGRITTLAEVERVVELLTRIVR